MRWISLESMKQARVDRSELTNSGRVVDDDILEVFEGDEHIPDILIPEWVEPGDMHDNY
jgi:hypothetical protein